MKIKVALSADSRGVSNHRQIKGARRSKKEHGSAYHIYIKYEPPSGKPTKWQKYED